MTLPHPDFSTESRCGNCGAFADPWPHVPASQEGRCRRRSGDEWPIVVKKEWCAEWIPARAPKGKAKRRVVSKPSDIDKFDSSRLHEGDAD